ncbi:MFS transporter [Flexivirga aerilata]
MLVLCVLLPRWAGRIIGRRGPWPPLLWGMAVLAAASLLLAPIGSTSAYLTCVPGLLAMGVGIALAVPAVSGAAVTDVPPALTASASATLSAARQTGGVLGVAVLGSVVATDIESRIASAFCLIAAVITAVLIPAVVLDRNSSPNV